MSRGRGESSVRIVGGQWRGRRLNIVGRESLRPTPDRVRETLFNWLAPYVHGATCLDLFAGSGALGFEALSRGAQQVDFVDNDELAIAELYAAKAALGAINAVIYHSAASDWLRRDARPYDIVFLDPPFSANLLPESLEALGSGWVASHTRIYVEQSKGDDLLVAPWEIAKRGVTKQVSYALLEMPR
ncbi:MAG: 16S rRNA (guanine(966)-N(2))-methyltransferase RsmD [Pseudomonadota bacterium]